MKDWLSEWASGETEARKDLKSLDGYWVTGCGSAAVAWPEDAAAAVAKEAAVSVQCAGHSAYSGRSESPD